MLRVYTTRPDTLYGATYMVIAPEHPFVDRLTTPEQSERRAGLLSSRPARKSDLDRTDLAKEKTGVFTGSHAINPVNAEPIPIWVADYVLISYGTGAIMAVPAHDDRDFEFAVTVRFAGRARSSIRVTASGVNRDSGPGGNEAFSGLGIAINSGHTTDCRLPNSRSGSPQI